MADVFISYSRADAAVVRRIHAGLLTAGREPWVDWNDIPPTAQWMEEIRSAIDAAQDVVVVLSPAALDSATCRREWEHAVRYRKRLVPVVVRDVRPEDVPQAIASLNWIPCRDAGELDAAVASVVRSLDTDLGLVKIHTRVLTRASQWIERGRDDGYLLRGSELGEALVWLTASGDRRGPLPSSLHSEYVQASQQAEARELARTTRLYNQAVARHLAAQAREVERERPATIELSVLLAVESVRRFATAEATTILRELVPFLPRLVARIDVTPTQKLVAFSPRGDLLATAAGQMSPLENIQSMTMEDFVDQADMERWDAIRADTPENPSYGVVHLWDPTSGSEVAHLDHDRSVLAIAFTPDGRGLAARTSAGVETLWSLDTFEEVPGPVPPGLLDEDRERYPRRRRAAVPHLDPVYDLRDRRTVQEALLRRGIEIPARWRSKVDSVDVLLEDLFGRAEDFTDDGRYFFRADRAALSVRSTTDQHEICRIPGWGFPGVLAVHPSDRVVATPAVAAVRVWETAGEWTSLVARDDFPFERFRFSPDGTLVGALDRSGRRTQTRAWDLRTCSPVTDAACLDALREAMPASSQRMPRPGHNDHSGLHLVAGWEHWGRTVTVRATAHAEPFLTVEADESIQDVRISPDDAQLSVCTATEARVHSLPDGRPIGAFRLDPGSALTVAVPAPDGDRIAVGNAGGWVVVRRIRSGEQLGRFAHEASICDAVFTADNRYLITASRDAAVRVWDLDDGSCVGRWAPDSAVERAALSPDESVLAGLTSNGSLALWRWWRPDDLVDVARRRLTRELSDEEWTLYLGDDPRP